MRIFRALERKSAPFLGISLGVVISACVRGYAEYSIQLVVKTEIHIRPHKGLHSRGASCIKP
ncbi:hypothetical protein DDF84_029020 [Cupriavidus metallidurans]|uniref:Uncharacterized protein n=1 Tax=Cupriavidus metallidurans TaxID=119219 RepID=A0A482J3I1_9BURK|nr:hypothetical protein DDF84_029020 [Cupriavidus metallidurans]